MGMAENNIEWGARGEIEFNIKSNLNKKLLFRQAVLYTFGQDCSLKLYLLFLQKNSDFDLPNSSTLMSS